MEPGRLSGFRDWIVWMEKFGQPTPIASYSEETDEESKNVAAKIIRAADGPGRVRIAATALGSENRATRSDARILGQTFAIGHGIQRTPAGSSHVPERLAERRRQTGFGASLSGHRPGGVLPWLVRGIERAVAYSRIAKAADEARAAIFHGDKLVAARSLRPRRREVIRAPSSHSCRRARDITANNHSNLDAPAHHSRPAEFMQLACMRHL
jgi:hypothetical protein